VNAALALLEGCSCDDSCYQCLRSYKNRFEHSLFDRRIGADLLKACFKGTPLNIDRSREDYALLRLQRDLAESGATITQVDGGLLNAGGKLICLSHPFQETVPCSPRAQTLAKDREAIAVDILLVLRALPIATNVALSTPNVGPNVALEIDENGTPEISTAMAIAGELNPKGDTSRFAVPGALAGDVIFRVVGNMLTAKNGDGAGKEVPSGTLCLFRPFVGEPSKTDTYLIRRIDGKAFGATSAEWTVGILQTTTAGMRVRYRAASQHMECVSELVMPATAVQPLAIFVRAVG
jgi:hypothetical protein